MARDAFTSSPPVATRGGPFWARPSPAISSSKSWSKPASAITLSSSVTWSCRSMCIFSSGNRRAASPPLCWLRSKQTFARRLPQNLHGRINSKDSALWSTPLANSFESSVSCTNVRWYLNQSELRGMGGAGGCQHYSGRIYDCLSQVSPVSIANLGTSRRPSVAAPLTTSSSLRTRTHRNIEKVCYVHRNPVVRGLVLEPLQWRWSSSRHYAYDEPVPVLVYELQKGELHIREIS